MFGFDLWGFLIHSIPWYVQILLLAIPVAALFYFAVGIFGWERVKGWIGPALAILAAFGLLSRQRQAGYQDRKTEEDRAREEAEDFVDKKQDEVSHLPDVELNDKVDKWSKR
jgi:hypothetical protein